MWLVYSIAMRMQGKRTATGMQWKLHTHLRKNSPTSECSLGQPSKATNARGGVTNSAG